MSCRAERRGNGEVTQMTERDGELRPTVHIGEGGAVVCARCVHLEATIAQLRGDMEIGLAHARRDYERLVRDLGARMDAERARVIEENKMQIARLEHTLRQQIECNAARVQRSPRGRD